MEEVELLLRRLWWADRFIIDEDFAACLGCRSFRVLRFELLHLALLGSRSERNFLRSPPMSPSHGRNSGLGTVTGCLRSWTFDSVSSIVVNQRQIRY